MLGRIGGGAAAAPHPPPTPRSSRELTHALASSPPAPSPCRNKYNEWVLCLKKNDKDESKCFLPRFNMRELCPGEWVEKWDADRDGDKFAGLSVDE